MGRQVVAAVFAVMALWGVTGLPRAQAETVLERGAYLVRGPAACGACHTSAEPAAGDLAGGRRCATSAYTALAATLTPDPETGLASWSDEEIVAGLREGKRPHGSPIGPPMPTSSFRFMAEDDARAIVAYLRSLAPVANKVRRSVYRVAVEAPGGPLGPVHAPDAAEGPVRLGAYLATGVAHCMACHARRGEDGMPDLAHGAGAGGAEFRGAWGVSIAPNITPAGIGYYSDDDLRRVITTGTRPDGSKLQPPMPVAYYANMREGDVSAIIAYLRSLPKQ